ncbi:hypothetical protein IWW37_002928 [Coemansia sp. RSA 2050]|nr:hypothetical protein IWW37_002928 [Coemansia sp. RSA 2050]
MGQSFSQYNSEQGGQPSNNQNRQEQSAPPGRGSRGNVRRSARNIRGGNSEREDSGRSESRYSPYTTGSRASAPRANVPELTQAMQQAASEAGAGSQGNVEVVQRVMLEVNDPYAEDAGMQGAGARSVVGTARARARARVRAGNRLLSAIVGRSVVSSIAQELGRRTLADGSAYAMDSGGRTGLCYHVSLFILSVLEASIDEASSDGETGQVGAESAAGRVDQSIAGSLGLGAPEEASSAAGDDDPVRGLQFRMFLLPGAIDRALADHTNTRAAAAAGAETQEGIVDEQTPGEAHSGGPALAEPASESERATDDEQQRRRESTRLEREEKLRQLRDIARAMHDERQSIQVPVAVLGLRMNSELRRSTRAAFQSLRERIGTPAPPTPIHSAIRELRSRFGHIVPSFLAGTESQPETIVAEEEEENAGEQQPGLSVFITIHYMQLGNPLLLSMAAYALFPELAADDGSREAGNYELFLEIASILGQARNSTVSQELVDKSLGKYRFCSRDGCPVAVSLEEEEAPEIALISADRCPVCLEEFVEGDTLRVLECHHGLHLMCGDAWFTKGSNKCPICRSEAVHE